MSVYARILIYNLCDHLGYTVDGLFQSTKNDVHKSISIIQAWSWSNFEGLNMIYQALLAIFFLITNTLELLKISPFNLVAYNSSI